MSLTVKTWQEAQALIDMDPRSLDDQLRNARHAALNEWMQNTHTGKLYQRLVLTYAPFTICMHTSKDRPQPGRLYVGGSPEGVWFYIERPVDFDCVSSDMWAG